ncbi:RNA degradosome polyphosphate kinase [Pacificimonas flava]|uniref:Polyphosphate kinase n=2 Tax=Pacificimonas TaxID=1960290 RepID=A0A219B8T2_9SPHN|nr:MULTISPECIES: RNA degradosome polyphosphate kinase [Pacificimonas]MBZ6378546.1 RNA degradosome polyphosphate kinase [Pacificimonas aurantium]OWV34168.1 RNA degradosome polyphosphate kinase [Pacificimonas flava]
MSGESTETQSVEAFPAAERFFNRELSWLKFNERVLEEANNSAYPLLERLKFLAICGDNLDEFYMVRVAGLHGQVEEGVETLTPEGQTPAQQLKAVRREADQLTARQQDIWNALHGELDDVGIEVLVPDTINADEKAWLERYFLEQIFPVLTPQTLDPAHPFPFIPNLGFGLIMELEHPDVDEERLTLVIMPPSLDRFVRLPGTEARYVALENIVRLFVHEVFPGYAITGDGVFRIIRDSDIEVEEEAEDLVRYFQTAIKRRRRGDVIRLKVEERMPTHLRRYVRKAFRIDEEDMSVLKGMIGLSDLMQLYGEERPELKFPPYDPRFPERIREHGGDCFSAIGEKDIIVHHPYESFEVVVAFLRQAAADPNVVAIKQTLYRAGKQSAVIRALIDAAEAGKSVTAVVELKARFDEEQNLAWAAELERAGVQVVYGFIEWKTHAKMSLVVRREGQGMRTYCHFGTGNYHPVTAKIYTDLSLFTSDPVLGRDVAQVFNYITSYVEPSRLEAMSIAPVGIRARIEGLIDREIENLKSGKPAGIWMKMNSLVDAEMIDKLYEASMAGVPIELVVRGICCLRPGVEGLSPTIRVRSIVGRFLEHSRIYAFANGAELPSRTAKVFISSADLMPRNLNRRVEALVPISNHTVHAQVLDQVMLANLKDTEQSWEMMPDGSYVRISAAGEQFNVHHYFMNNPSLSGRGTVIDEAPDVPRLDLTGPPPSPASAGGTDE